MLKVHCSQSINNLIDSLVYQCEICGQCNPSISQLRIHRSQVHARDNVAIQKRIVSIASLREPCTPQ